MFDLTDIFEKKYFIDENGNIYAVKGSLLDLLKQSFLETCTYIYMFASYVKLTSLNGPYKFEVRLEFSSGCQCLFRNIFDIHGKNATFQEAKPS